jgi:hypothetical protein
LAWMTTRSAAPNNCTYTARGDQKTYRDGRAQQGAACYRYEGQSQPRAAESGKLDAVPVLLAGQNARRCTRRGSRWRFRKARCVTVPCKQTPQTIDRVNCGAAIFRAAAGFAALRFSANADGAECHYERAQSCHKSANAYQL